MSYSQDRDEEIILYRDQGVSAEKHDKETYGDLIKMDSEEEQNIKYNVALCTRDITHHVQDRCGHFLASKDF